MSIRILIADDHSIVRHGLCIYAGARAVQQTNRAHAEHWQADSRYARQPHFKQAERAPPRPGVVACHARWLDRKGLADAVHCAESV